MAQEEGVTPRLVVVKAEDFSALRTEEKISLDVSIATEEVV